MKSGIGMCAGVLFVSCSAFTLKQSTGKANALSLDISRR